MRERAGQGVLGSEPIPQLVSGDQSGPTTWKLHSVPHSPGQADVESSSTGQGPQTGSGTDAAATTQQRRLVGQGWGEVTSMMGSELPLR